MQRAVLFYQYTAIDFHHLMIGECNLDYLRCKFVLLRLSVDRHQYRMIHNQEIGIGSRQSVSLLVIHGIGQWQFYKVVRLSRSGHKRLKLKLHLVQLIIVAVGDIVSAYI